MTVKARFVRIGKARRIRVPEKAEPPIIEGTQRRRIGWAELARVMSERGHDDLLDEPTATRFDREGWKWK